MYRNVVGVIIRPASSIQQNALSAMRDVSSGMLGRQTISTRDVKSFWVLVITSKNGMTGNCINILNKL